MWHYMVGASVLWWLTQGQKKEEAPAPAVNPDPLAALIPVDASAPAELAAAVRDCWQRGTQSDLVEFAQALGLSYPVSRSTLLARAYELSVAQSRMAAMPQTVPVAPAPAPAPAEAHPAQVVGSVVNVPAKENGRVVVKPATVRALSKEEIHAAEMKAVAKASETNGKKLTPIDIPTAEIVATAEESADGAQPS
jgi:hypothetical protein